MKDNALLVNLTISQWSGRKFDHKVTGEVNEAHDTHDAGRFTKLLVAKKSLAPIVSAAGSLRTFHYFHTLPWGDNGDRLLPSAKYMDYMKKAGELKREFDSEVTQFVEDYDQALRESQNRLKDLYNASDYPTTDQIRNKFGVHFGFSPLPQLDFRLDLVTETQLDEIKSSILSDMEMRHKQAISDLFSRAHDCIKRVIETLSEEGKVFRNSLVTNIERLVEALPALNYTNDSTLTEITDKMRTLIIEPDNLRKDAKVRETYLRRAQELDKMYF